MLVLSLSCERKGGEEILELACWGWDSELVMG